MVVNQPNPNLTPASNADENYDRAQDLKIFDATKSGVKGLVDAGITEIPRIFFRQPENDDSKSISVSGETQFSIPVIDLEDAEKDSMKRKEIVERVREASEKWGIFQLINHGIPMSDIEEMKETVRRFHEQDTEIKKQYYTRDLSKPLIYNSNFFDLYSAATTNWRDSFFYICHPNPPNPKDLPEICRDEVIKYSKQLMELGNKLFKLLSEALGLNPNHLNDLDSNEGLALICHYYPACPQPKLAIGTSEHTDNDFITVLLQDHIGGLQFHHQNKWIDIPPVSGALVVNIGDLMQIITNGIFKSIKHRVVANQEGPRISVAGIFSTPSFSSNKLYGPIKELLSENNPPIYRESTMAELNLQFRTKGIRVPTLEYFKL